MQQSYARQLLYNLSLKLGRKPQDMERFINILEDQWYDTKEALAKLTPADYARLQIPQRLATMISEAVGASKSQKIQEKMDIESPVEGYLYELKNKLSKQDFDEIIGTLSKIFNNIRENLINEKYRTLKRSNAKINILTSFKEVVKVLIYGGFEETGPGFVMNKVNISQIDDCIENISKFETGKSFNPYESHVSSIGKTTIENYEGPSSVMYNQMLEDLQKERNRIMSQPILDRKIKVFQIEPHYTKEFDAKFQEDRQNDEESKYIELQNMKEILKKQGEQPKFVNRRMQEYNLLVNQPVYSETIIRVKLPDNWIFECRFSPLQPLQALVDIFHECLINKNLDYYLYMTPPVEKLRGVILRKTFYDLGCVPRAYFYMKYQQKILDNIFKIKKSNY